MKIAIDAGHGPNTPGKRAPDGSLREFDFNSAVAKMVASRLLEFGHETIAVHRHFSDRRLPKRTAEANKWGADLYISIHANAAGKGTWNSALGVETYCYKRGRRSEWFAHIVQTNIIKATGRRDRGVKTATFWVLRKTKMPAVLIECGFMTNRKELELLKSDEYRESIADAIVLAANAYAEKYCGERYGYGLSVRVEGQTEPIPSKMIDGALWVKLRPLCDALGATIDTSKWPVTRVNGRVA